MYPQQACRPAGEGGRVHVNKSLISEERLERSRHRVNMLLAPAFYILAIKLILELYNKYC